METYQNKFFSSLNKQIVLADVLLHETQKIYIFFFPITFPQNTRSDKSPPGP